MAAQKPSKVDFQGLLRFAVEHKASDVHIQASARPMMRIGGQARSVESDPLTNDDIRNFVAAIAPDRQDDGLERPITQ